MYAGGPGNGGAVVYATVGRRSVGALSDTPLEFKVKLRGVRPGTYLAMFFCEAQTWNVPGRPRPERSRLNVPRGRRGSVRGANSATTISVTNILFGCSKLTFGQMSSRPDRCMLRGPKLFPPLAPNMVVSSDTMLRNSACGPEIGFPGRIADGFFGRALALDRNWAERFRCS